MQVDSRRGDLAIAVLLLAVAAFFLWGAWQMPAGTFAVPGPGIVPTILGSLLAVAALGLIVKSLLAAASGSGLPVSFGISSAAIVFAALTGVALAFERAGCVLTLSAFMFVMLRVFSPLGTLRSALVAAAVAFASSWFFGTLLGVNLPRTPW